MWLDGLGTYTKIRKGTVRVFKKVSYTVLRHLLLFFAITLFVSASSHVLPLLKTEVADPSAPHCLLDTLQTQQIAVRSCKPLQNDDPPVGDQLTRRSAAISPDGMKSVRFGIIDEISFSSTKIGWQARAPPIRMTLAEL